MNIRPSAWALSPLMLFLVLYFGAGLYYSAQGVPMAFYQLRAPVAILPAVVLGLWFARRRGLQAQDTLLKGIADPDIVLMCLIFLRLSSLIATGQTTIDLSASGMVARSKSF